MFTVQLQQFAGPLDLLVFFIQRDELDIYDIPIARITEAYLGYVRDLSRVDLDAAGEFIFFAALLIQIKARMLMPTEEVDEAGEPVDPRKELVERLLEYVRFKEAAAALDARHELRRLHFTRPAGEEETTTVETLGGHRSADLVRALRRLLLATPPVVQHAVKKLVVTVEEQMAALSVLLARGRAVAFGRYTRQKPRPFAIAAFLAVLELVRRGGAHLRAGAGDDFSIEPVEA